VPRKKSFLRKKKKRGRRQKIVQFAGKKTRERQGQGMGPKEGEVLRCLAMTGAKTNLGGGSTYPKGQGHAITH